MDEELGAQLKALRSSKGLGCSGAHLSEDGEWMPCESFAEYKSAIMRVNGHSRLSEAELEDWRSRRKRRGKNRNRSGWQNLTERGINGIQTAPNGGLVRGPAGVPVSEASGPISSTGTIVGGTGTTGSPGGFSAASAGSGIQVKAITGAYSPRDNDNDVFVDIESARQRSRQMGCIGVSRRISKTGKTVWMPCTNMSDYSRLAGTTDLGRMHQREATQKIVRTVLKDSSKKKKSSLAYDLHEYKALGRTLRNLSPGSAVAFDPSAIDGDGDGVIQEGTPFKRPATPSAGGLKTTGLNPKELVNNPQLDKSTLQLSKEMGFNAGDYEYDWTKHPSRSYDLKPNKPVTIAAARVDPVENAKKILSGEAYKPNSGSYGLGVGFAFDGDDHLLNGWYEEYAHMGAKNRSVSLTANLSLEKPFVYSAKADRLSEVKKNIGDENRIVNLSKTALEKLGDSNSGEKEKLQRIVSSGGKLNKADFNSKVINLLARENGNDAMIRLSDDDGPDSTQILLLDLKKAKFTGIRETGTKQSEMGWLHSEIDAPSSAGSSKNQTDNNLKAISSALKAYHSLSEKDKTTRFGPSLDVIEAMPREEAKKVVDEFVKNRPQGLKSIGANVNNPEATPANPFNNLGGKAMGKLILDEVDDAHKGKTGQKTTYFIGGTTGAGKGVVVEHLQKVGIIPTDQEAAHIDPDFIKLGLPGYNDGAGVMNVHHTSRVATDHVISDAGKAGMDTIIQGTGKRDEHLVSARNSGNKTVGHFVYAPIPTATKRQQDRAKKTNRNLPSGFPAQIAGEIQYTLDNQIKKGLYDELHIWDNSGDISKGEKPKLIASKVPGKPMVIHDQTKFDDFAGSSSRAKRWEQMLNEGDKKLA
jgi:hypothetical protein